MWIMELEILPGPSLAELARTAMARAAAATVSEAHPDARPGLRVDCPGDGEVWAAAVGEPAGEDRAIGGDRVPVRDRADGSPLLLAAAGSMLEQRLTSCPDAVTVSVPASVPFAALRITGTARAVARDHSAGITACAVAVRSVEFTGAARRPGGGVWSGGGGTWSASGGAWSGGGGAWSASGGAWAEIPVEEYHAAAPDPLWQVAPNVLRHLEHEHMAELTGCVQAHGLVQADWVVPRGLDRYGLELLVLMTDGTAAVRLSFPDGPVSSLDEVPASIRTVLTCRCGSRRETGPNRPCEPS
jgi:hypothetical protein